MNMRHCQEAVAALAAASVLFSAATVSAADGSCCSVCEQKVCHLDVGQKEVDIDGFEVERKNVCIPPVRFWWECGPIKRCGKVRTVNKLVKKTHTKTECTYDWSVVAICRDCYRKIHRLRCDQFGLGPDATPEQVGLRTPPPIAASDATQGIRFRHSQRMRLEGASFHEDEQEWMLTDED